MSGFRHLRSTQRKGGYLSGVPETDSAVWTLRQRYERIASPLFEYFPGAAAGYSLRQLAYDYTGPVVTVRRSSDSVEDDFTASEVADGTLAAFCGAGDGLVKTLYDQSGNGRDASQSTATAQPKIVSSGVLVLENGLPAMEFDGTDDYIQAAGYKPSGNFAAFGLFAYSSLATIQIPFSCHKPVSPSGGFSFFNYTPGPTKIALQTGLGGSWVDGVSELDLGDFDLNPTLIAFQIRAAGTTMHKDGVNILDSAEGLIAEGNDLLIGGNAASPGGDSFNGTWQELIIYPVDQSANRVAIEDNINSHYNVF